MKTNQFVCMIIVLVVSMAFITMGIVVGENNTRDMRIKELTEDYLNQYAQLAGCKSLGVIDAYAVSQETGSIYDGRRIEKRLFEQNGLEFEENTWDFFIEETANGVLIFKKVVYQGEQRQPIMQQPVKEVYLYGLM